MKILAFSDWRIQNIEKLIEYVKDLDPKPDIIVYAGDDIVRFNKISNKKLAKPLAKIYLDNSPSKNYFEELAKYSNHGLVAVAGNDDLSFSATAISGKGVYDIFRKPLVISNYVFIGIEGATKPPGLLLHSEKEIFDKLKSALKNFPNKEIIIVSHPPPLNILDVGIRFGINHIGSASLRKFLDENYNKIKIIFCGHVHSQGGKEVVHKGVTVINCASHDNEGEPGKVCLVNCTKDIETDWNLIYEWGPIKKEISELMEVPLVGYSRASALVDMGIKSVEQLAKFDKECDTSEHPCFNQDTFDLIRNYAKAIESNRPIVTGRHPFFDNSKKVYFFDAEYNPVGTKNGPYGIFLLGIMDNEGNAKQYFLNGPEDEKAMLTEFRNWLMREKPILVAYSSTSADKPQLISTFERFGIPTTELSNSFFDLYYECINTQRTDKQFIFLPMEGSMGVKEVSVLLGYKEPKNMEITNGLQALIEYEQFLETKNIKIKKELLRYNRVDLERTRFIFNIIDKLMKNF
jgi:Icc-related predicted phosphoesterase/uncharacterized protein YprB with RNaseH-like and TPR domain